MPFEQAAALLPTWVQYWINFIVLVPVLSIIALLFHKETRKSALIIFLLIGAGMMTVLFLYMQLGMVRLLGLGHVIFWTPAAIYLWRQLQNTPPPSPYRQIMWILMLTIVAALVFDYADVVRWLLGERASVV